MLNPYVKTMPNGQDIGRRIIKKRDGKYFLLIKPGRNRVLSVYKMFKKQEAFLVNSK